MTAFQPAYRARIYAPKSVDPTETTILTPAAGAPHSDPFQVATIAGVTGYSPYLAIPKGRRTRTNFLTKKSDIGALSLSIIDPRVNALTGTHAERWFTAFWGDTVGRPALGSCRVEVDESLDGGESWNPFYTGRVDESKTHGRLQGTISVKDLMGDLERPVFVSDPIDVPYARRLPIIPLGLTEPFGSLLPTAPLMPGRSTPVETAQRYGFACGQNYSSDPDILGHMKVPRALADLASKDYTSSLSERLMLFAPKKVRVRIVFGGVVSWWWLNSLRAELVKEADTIHWRPRRVAIFRADELNAAPASWPAEGTTLTWAFYASEGPASEASPILVDAADPVSFLADMMAGAFSPGSSVDGTPVAAARLDGASWSALTGVFPPMQFIVREKGAIRTWAIEYVCQALQLGLTMDARGRVVLLDLRRGETAEGLLELTDTDLLSDADAESLQQPSADAINTVITPTDYVQQLDRTPDFADVKDQYPDVPPGMLRVEEIKDLVADYGDPRAVDYLYRTTTVRLNGWPILLESGIPDPLAYIERVQRKSIRDAAVDALFAVFARGPNYFSLQCRRTTVVESVKVGTRVTVSTSALPDTVALQRGGSRVGLCLERSENGPAVTLSFVDLGLVVVSDPPSLDEGGLDGDPDDCSTVSVPVVVNAAEQSVVVGWATTPIGDPRPGDSAPGWTFGGRTDVTATVTIQGLPSGQRIHIRIRTEPTDGSGLPSAWVVPDPGFVDLCGIAGPTDCALTAGPTGGQLVTWVNADPSLTLQVLVDGVVVETLDPGTTQWNPQGATGTITIQAVDANGGIAPGCSVVVEPVGMTAPRPAGIQVLTPSAVAVAGFPAKSADGTIFNWRLYRIGDDGTGCPLPGVGTVIADNLPGTLSPIVYTDAQPVDGTIWWYAWSHVLPGWTESPLTCWRAGIAAPGTPPAPSVVLPTVTLTQSQDPVTGTAHATIDDPECRATLAEWKHQAGTDPETPYAEAVGPDFTETVALVPSAVSTIWFRVTGYLADGSIGVLWEGFVTFGPVVVPEPDPPVGITILDVPVTLVTGAPPLGIREFPEAATRLTEWRGTEKRVPSMAGWAAVAVHGAIAYSTCPLGSLVAIQHESASTPGEWAYLDGESGPVLPVDPASLDALDLNAAATDDAWVVAGEPVLLTDEAKAAVRFRAVGVGGTDTEDLLIAELTIWPTFRAEIPEPEMPEGPPEIPPSPGPCDEDELVEGFEGYADIDEVLTDWTFENPYWPGSSVHLDPTGGRGGGQCIRIDNPNATMLGHTGPQLSRLLDGLDPAAGNITFQGWYKKSAGAYSPQSAIVSNESGSSTRGVSLNSEDWVAFDTALSCTFTDGRARLRIGWGSIAYYTPTAGSIYFDDLSIAIDGVPFPLCRGSVGGGPGNTGNGDDGNEPPPEPPPGGYPPPPTGGTRPFGIHNISSGGLGFWNSTVKGASSSTIVGLLDRAIANACMDLFRFGDDASKLDAAGHFRFELWKAQVDAVYNNSIARAALEAAIAMAPPRAAWAHFLLDEPFHPRWGGISLATLDLMGAYSKSLYPTWRTLLRCAPNDSRLTRPIVGVDTYWAEYKLTNGDPTAYRNAVTAAAEAMDKDVVIGIHYGAFPKASSGIVITTAQLLYYGTILASSTSSKVVAMGGWKWTSAMNAQSGFPASAQSVRNTFAALD